jgi:hypothetical protein
MWKSNQRIIADIREELRKERESNAPEFEGSIQQIMTGRHGSPDAPLMVLLLMTVLNRGAASFVENWTVALTIAGQRIDLPVAQLPDRIELPVGNQMRVITKADAIYDKGDRIERGDRIRGILPAIVGDLVTQEQFHHTGNFIEVSFTDFTHHTYTARETMKEGKGELMYYPGGPKFELSQQPPANRTREQARRKKHKK